MADYTIPIFAHNESTIDYPGKMGEILFLPGCNLQCGFCHNPELSQGHEGKVDLEILLKNIKMKTRAGWYQGICVSGGEPTIYPNLPEFIKKLRTFGLEIKLDTNGVNPKMLKDLLEEKIVDYVAMDIKTTRDKYQEVVKTKIDLKRIDESIELVKKFPKYEFRTTVLPSMTIDDFEKIGNWISNDRKDKIMLYTMQQFKPETTLDPEYSKMKPKENSEFNDFLYTMESYCHRVRMLI